MKQGINSANFVIIAQGIRPCGALYCEVWSNFSKNFSFWGSIPLSLRLHRWGWNLARRPPCQISPHRCNVTPLRGENLKIALWVT